MPAWLLRRILASVLLVLALASAVFFLVRLAPGGPLGSLVQSEDLSAVDRELIRARYGLDQPLAGQYLRWLGGAVRGDFGWSITQQRPVAAILAEAIGPTLLLTLAAYALHLLLALGTALAMAARRGRPLEHVLRAVGLTFYSVPTFWLGLLLLMLAGRVLGWLPLGGMRAPDAEFLSAGARLVDLLHHLVLPVVTLALGTFMGTARYLQATLDEVLGQDYITAARARGIGEPALLYRHALRNALLPLITLGGLHLPALLGGAVAVETVFAWPGLGRVTVEALWARDYPLIMATTVVAASAVVAGSLLADLLYHRADPRLRRPGSGPR